MMSKPTYDGILNRLPAIAYSNSISRSINALQPGSHIPRLLPVVPPTRSTTLHLPGLHTHQDLADLKWSPQGGLLCAIDTVLQYQVLIYTAAGEHLQSYRPYDDALGVKSFGWSPGGEVLAIGSYDERMRVLNYVTWQRIAECEHPTEVGAVPIALGWRKIGI